MFGPFGLPSVQQSLPITCSSFACSLQQDAHPVFEQAACYGKTVAVKAAAIESLAITAFVASNDPHVVEKCMTGFANLWKSGALHRLLHAACRLTHPPPQGQECKEFSSLFFGNDVKLRAHCRLHPTSSWQECKKLVLGEVKHQHQKWRECDVKSCLHLTLREKIAASLYLVLLGINRRQAGLPVLQDLQRWPPLQSEAGLCC